MSKILASRRVRLTRNDGSQVVRIPREFELPGDEAILRKESSGRLTLEAVLPKSLLKLLNSWQPLEAKDSFPEIEDRLPENVSL